MARKNNRLQLGGRIVTGALAVLFLLIVCLFGYTAIARARGNPLPTVFGWGSAVVLSGSMEPELPVGALLVIHRETSYHPGEIVTYEDVYGSLITHRLVSLENGEATTKGDANNTGDAPFAASRIRGEVKAVFPGVGRAILWLQTPPGLCTILLVGGILLFVPKYILKLVRKVGKTHDRT